MIRNRGKNRIIDEFHLQKPDFSIHKTVTDWE